MAEEKSASTYGAVGSSQPISEDEPQERVRSVDSFYRDQITATKDHRIISDRCAENTQLHAGELEEKPSKELCLSSDTAQIHQDTDDMTTPEKLPRPTRVSFSNGKPTTPTNEAVSPISARHVSFIKEANQNESTDASTAYDNRGFSDIQSSSDSITRVRAITNGSVHYRTHSEGEECNESEISLALNFHQNSQTTPRRRRRYTRHGTMVSDSFVNECICCCTII